MDMAPLSHSSTLTVVLAANTGTASSDATKVVQARNKVLWESAAHSAVDFL